MTTEPKSWEVRVSIVGKEGIFAMVTGTDPKECFDRAMELIDRNQKEKTE